MLGVLVGPQMPSAMKVVKTSMVITIQSSVIGLVETVDFF